MAIHRLHCELDTVGLSHPSAEAVRPLAHVHSPAALEGFGEGIAVEAVDGNRCRPGPGLGDELTPEELVAEERHHDGRQPGA